MNGQIDYMLAKSKGSTNSNSNAKVLTRKENRRKLISKGWAYGNKSKYYK